MHDVDWELLFRYLGKEASAGERRRVEAWLDADPAHRALLEAAAAAADHTLNRLPRTPAQPRIHVARAMTPAPFSRSLAAAAVVLLCLGGTMLWRVTADRSARARALPMRVASTLRGERDSVRLADGTLVVLGAASTLRFPAAFGEGSREVSLVGEGYFEVAHDVRHPFRVHAGGATAEDIGTAFGVRALAADSVMHVVVAEGAVALGPASRTTGGDVVLTRGQLGQLTRGAPRASVRKVDVDSYLGWMRGRLSFDETPLSEVTVELSRWYRADFRFADSSLAHRRLTGTVKNGSLDATLAVLAPALDVRFERAGDTVVVHPGSRTR